MKGLAKMEFALPLFIELIPIRVTIYLCFTEIMRMGMLQITSGLNRFLFKLLKFFICLSLFFNISGKRRRNQSRHPPNSPQEPPVLTAFLLPPEGMSKSTVFAL